MPRCWNSSLARGRVLRLSCNSRRPPAASTAKASSNSRNLAGLPASKGRTQPPDASAVAWNESADIRAIAPPVSRYESLSRNRTEEVPPALMGMLPVQDAVARAGVSARMQLHPAA